MALTNGKDCWCGDLVPALQFKRPNSECDTPCAGFDKDTCGGYRRWQVFTTGYSLNEPKHYQVKNVEAGKSTVISSSNSAGQTVYTTVAVSSSTSDSSQSDSSGGTSTVGIAAGVVAGVVGLSAIIGGTFLWLRHKKRAEAEKERQENAVASFMEAGRKPQTSQSSLSDSRLDPDILSRRQSDGSIADNQDFSRRILQITNPDGY
jgi:cell wall integrity and stress response component